MSLKGNFKVVENKMKKKVQKEKGRQRSQMMASIHTIECREKV